MFVACSQCLVAAVRVLRVPREPGIVTQAQASYVAGPPVPLPLPPGPLSGWTGRNYVAGCF